jgi:hypothetical protein
VWALTNSKTEKPEGQGYLITPDGHFQQHSATFIAFEFQQYQVDGLLLFQGTCRWNEASDPERKPAIVPVRLFRNDPENQQLQPIALYYTEEDGKFYLVTKDDGREYSLGPVTNRAANMPEKVKQFFENLKKQQEQNKG